MGVHERRNGRFGCLELCLATSDLQSHRILIIGSVTIIIIKDNGSE